MIAFKPYKSLPKTRKQCAWRYDLIMRQARRAMAGGLSFGMDWPTLRGTDPDRYEALQELAALYWTLPEGT